MAKRWQQNFSFGGRLPWAVGLLLSVIVVLSLIAAFGDRHVSSLFDAAALIPGQVWRGAIWRLITWTFVSPGPVGLIVGCLLIFWFAPDLAREWGSRRFLAVFGGVMLAAAAGTCLIALVDRPVLQHAYLGIWPLVTAITIAWGLWFPDRVISLFFVLLIRGWWMVWLTVAFTVVYAVYFGWDNYLPELLGEASILAWSFRRKILSRFTKARRSLDSRRREAKRLKGARKRGKVVVDYLRAVEPPKERDSE
jgi:membrane associated rhomboid family serine protease